MTYATNCTEPCILIWFVKHNRKEDVKMENANFKIASEDKTFLKRLIASGTYSSLSEIYRTALDEFISKYTDRPSLMGLSQRQDRQQARLNGIKRELEEVRKALAEIKENNG